MRAEEKAKQSGAMSAAAIASRRALQQQRARILYRRSLRSVLSWAVHRDIFYVEVRRSCWPCMRHIRNDPSVDLGSDFP